jgi:hypothetical protein
MMGLSRSLKRKLLLAMGAIALLIAVCSLFAYSAANRRIPIEAVYLRSPNGLFAEVGFAPDALHLPLLQLAGCTVEASLFVWTDRGWKRGGSILSYGWDAKKGARARLSVPDSKWKIEFRAAPTRQLKIRALTIPVGIKTNILAVAEFPPRQEIEAAKR